MRKCILLFAIIFTTSFAKAQTPIDLNDKLVSITDSLFKYGQAWGKKLNEVVVSKEFGLLKAESMQMSKFLDRNIFFVSSMKDISGSENLRKSMIEFLKFEKTLMQRTFLPFESFTKATTKEELQRAFENLQVQSANETEAIQKVNVEQLSYAEKNGFTIEKK